jgi:hypothetical protein
MMINQLSQFRIDLYNVLPHRADAVINLIDSLASTPSAQSVVELSLSEFFRRKHSSVYDAVEQLFKPTSPQRAVEEHFDFQKELLRLSVPYLPQPIKRKFFLFGVDSVTLPRLYAYTLKDRAFVHQPTVIRGNKPITIGHSYSFLAALPEPKGGDYTHWVFPLSAQRIASTQKATEVAQKQFHLLLGQDDLGLRNQFCVAVGDTAYSAANYLFSTYQYENLVTIARLRGTRKLYRPHQVGKARKKKFRGRPQWYGKAVRINEVQLWQAPDESTTVQWTTTRGKTYTVTISAINNLRMRGKKKAPMHDKPLRGIRIEVTDQEGQAVYKNPLHLVVFGKRQNELTLPDIYDSFKERFNLEHFFRFGKQRLLLASAQTPIVETEENWCNIATLTYQQLFLARQEAQQVRQPWESKTKVAKKEKRAAKSPSATQRDFARIIRGIGTPAQSPKPRNKSNGRAQGFKPEPRPRFEVVKKT